MILLKGAWKISGPTHGSKFSTDYLVGY